MQLLKMTSICIAVVAGTPTTITKFTLTKSDFISCNNPLCFDGIEQLQHDIHLLNNLLTYFSVDLLINEFQFLEP